MKHTESILNILKRLDKNKGFHISVVQDEDDFRILDVENMDEFWKVPFRIACKKVLPRDVKKGDYVIYFNGLKPQKIVQITEIGGEEKLNENHPVHEEIIYTFYGVTLAKPHGHISFGCNIENYVNVIDFQKTDAIFKEMIK